MRVDPYLYFDGTCRAAFAFYADAIGGTIGTMMTYGESPVAGLGGPDMADRILHATLVLDDGSELLGSDALPGRATGGRGFAVTLQVDTVDDAERIFARLGDGAGTIVMPLQQTFWTQRFGQLVDRFGVEWIVNCR